jgi:TM2 domain-containing membrane protein YozV
MPSATVAARIDPDFARDVLEELYTYPRKIPALAWLLWAILGWAGMHRFYLGRVFTGALMLFTGGGGLVWWIADAWRLGGLVRRYNDEQSDRERTGRPPVGLSFMPPLSADVLSQPPPWLEQWNARARLRRGLRFAGDVLVLLVAGSALGGIQGTDGAAEALVAVLVLTAVTLLGAGPQWLHDLPVVSGLIRWVHRLRLFYYYNRPGSPPALLFRSVMGAVVAPLRRRDRAEVRLYLELGLVFTATFALLDVVPNVIQPLFEMGVAALAPTRLIGIWFKEALLTFIFTYAFAAPIGAVLTLYVLTRHTHTVARVLGVFVVFAMALGAGLLG